jgi:hypothetical protein
MIDCSGSTTFPFSSTQNVYQAIQDKCLATLSKRGIDRARFVFWSCSAKTIPDPVDLTGDDLSAIFVDNFTGGGTLLASALGVVPAEWRLQSQDLYIFTDGEIGDSDNEQLDALLEPYIKLDNRIYICTVEANERNYLSDNCEAGTRLYRLLRERALTNHIKEFSCYNRHHTEEPFVNFSNPVVPEGYAPFQGRIFQMSRLTEFLAHIERPVSDRQGLLEQLTKLAYDLSFTLHYFFRQQTPLINESLMTMVVAIFDDSGLEDVRSQIETAVGQYRQGCSSTFQEYRNNRQKLFERTQEALHENVKTNVTIVDCPLYVSFPLTINGQPGLITCGEQDVRSRVKLGFETYQCGGVEIGQHVVPVLPGNFRFLELKETNQSIRQWVRAVYASRFRKSGSSDFLQYRWLTDALLVYLSTGVPDQIREAFRSISLVMLSRVRYGTKDRELSYLEKGNPPATVLGSDSSQTETIDSILEQCIEQAALDLRPYTLWYGIVCMLNHGELIDIQQPFCKGDVARDFPDLEPGDGERFLKRLRERVGSRVALHG